MGLCKCPKRKVTNLFCFEHRVNVCESCLVANHHKCIVQSYLQWLQDSDYNPNCRLCGTLLAARDTVRLVCYDLFHWSCLAARARALPPRTAPAGYRCPSCGGPLFPPPNLEGPVAAALRARLAAAPWARPGLGLPLIEEAEAAPELEPEPEPEAAADTWGSFGAPPAAAEAPPSPPGAHAVVHVGTETLVLHGSAPRKPLGGRESRDPPDRDEDKYRRRRVLRCWPRGRPPRPPAAGPGPGGGPGLRRPPRPPGAPGPGGRRQRPRAGAAAQPPPARGALTPPRGANTPPRGQIPPPRGQIPPCQGSPIATGGPQMPPQGGKREPRGVNVSPGG